MDEEVQERQQVTVGKPLVSKLNLHEPRAAHVSSASSSFSLDSFNVPGCSSFGEDLSLTGTASNTWSHHAQSASVSFTGGSPTSPRSANVPEETDSPEILDNPRPLVASKSLPHSKVNDSNYKFSDMYNFHSYWDCDSAFTH